MRIGLVAPPWLPVPPPAYGGTENVVDLLARTWKAMGHDVVLATTGDSTCPVDRVWTHAEHQIDSIGEILPEFTHVSYAYEALADCDIVHDHTLLGPLVAPPANGWRGHALPIVATNHGPFDRQLLNVFRSIARRASITAISADQASRSLDVPIRRVIHHGIDPEAYPVGAGSGDYLLFLGRLSPDKGAHRAIEIARKTGTKLIIAAKCREPVEQQYFNECVRPLLGMGIDYIGEVSGIDKLELLGEARALINPIRWPEPFGLVMIEAMACGTPVLTFAEGAAPEIVDHGRTGFVVDDDDALAEAVCRIDELDRRACRRSVEGYFSASRMATEYVRLFESILEHGVNIDLVRSTATSTAASPAAVIDTPNGKRTVPVGRDRLTAATVAASSSSSRRSS